MGLVEEPLLRVQLIDKRISVREQSPGPASELPHASRHEREGSDPVHFEHLIDVDVSGKVNGYVVAWSSTEEKWVAVPMTGGGGGGLDEHALSGIYHTGTLALTQIADGLITAAKLQDVYSLSGHTHSYAPTPHGNADHSTAYAVEGHSHSYAPTPHDSSHHSVSYALAAHDHSGVYAPTPHDSSHHSVAYALSGHDHSGVYAPTPHDSTHHSVTYSLPGHTHSYAPTPHDSSHHSVSYAAASHTHAITTDITATAWRMFYKNATAMVELAFGDVGKVLTSGGASAVPTWETPVALATAGTNGAAIANAGDDTTAARGDHEHWVEHEVVFPVIAEPGTDATGDDVAVPLIFSNQTSGLLLEVFGYVDVAPATTDLVFSVQRCTRALMDGTPSWDSILSTNGTIYHGKRTTADPASTDPIVDTGDDDIAAYDFFRVYVVTGNATARRLTVVMRFKVKNV